MTKPHPFHDQLPLEAPILRRRALKLTTDKHRAEDLTQETLLKAWANRDSFQPGTNLSAWLFTIMRNTFFSSLRKYRREVQDIDGAGALALAEEGRQLHAVALRELLAAVVDLPPKQRRAIVLIGAYGFSQLEAAEACGCATGTIKSRVSRGRTALGHLALNDKALARGRTMHARPTLPLSQAQNAALTRVPMLAADAED